MNTFKGWEYAPNAFIETTSQKCAILSHDYPENFASKFGNHEEKEDIVNGLKYLLENNRCKGLGMKGNSYVKETFELNRAMAPHIKIYKDLIS